MYFIVMLALWSTATLAQSLDFERSNYYTLQGDTLLTTPTQTLTGFDYSTAQSTHPIFGQGLYFPVLDFQNKNIWVRLRHIAADPNGTAVGSSVPATWGGAFRAGLGGWHGFLYRFDIYADANPTGARRNRLGAITPTNITVESLETLSAGEWLSFRILNPQSSGWFLNSTNFTGNNPGSNPGFSNTINYNPGGNPPAGYSTNFVNGQDSVYVLDFGGSSYAEFRMSADQVSGFLYGYEYTQSFGYQGMTLSFGISSATAVRNKVENSKLKVYPTSTTDCVTLESALLTPKAELVAIDALGRRYSLRREGNTCSLAHLACGVYSLMLQTPQGQAVGVVIKE